MTARLFIAIPIPEQVAASLREAIQHFPQHVEKVVPEDKWHLTILFLGEIKNYSQYIGRLAGDIQQQFLPTITITHVGRGMHRGQLWAYAHDTSLLKGMRKQIQRRASRLHIPMAQSGEKRGGGFVPHVRLAKLHAASRGIGLADYPVGVTFSPLQAVIYSSELESKGSKYTSEGVINLVP